MDAAGDGDAPPSAVNLGAADTAAPGDGGGGNALILSLYLLGSEDDLLLRGDGGTSASQGDGIQQRARLYRRLCEACAVANGIVHSSSLEIGDSDAASRGMSTQASHLPWSSGGDGPMFGVHCDVGQDAQLDASGGVDGDEMWQFQSSQQSSQQSSTTSTNDEINEMLRKRRRRTGNTVERHQQPHLRAMCRYGNDANDMWRCVGLALKVSSELSSRNLPCAIECWDATDGHILLIEAAESLPSWVDDDVLQGGVGGPGGCRSRCWIVDGKVHLIPPLKDRAPTAESVDRLSRGEALSILTQSIHTETGESITVASEWVQRSIRERIDRMDYTNPKRRLERCHPQHEDDGERAGSGSSNPHWHVAAAALPASVAHFVQRHPSLVPLLVDSFCERAPSYLKERSSQRTQIDETTNNDASNDGAENGGEKSHSPNAQSVKLEESTSTLGATFPYEQMVVVPITLTRTNYAELVTGRGVVPSFPTPGAYRSVELNRFQRQLRQSAFSNDDFRSEEDSRRKNPFRRAVDVGVRLCAGLDWIVSSEGEKADGEGNASLMEDAAVQALGEVERRLRIYWTRIDAEASSGMVNDSSTGEQSDELSLQLPWIEEAWQAGPNGSMQNSGCDKSLIEALASMSKCRIHDPELSKPLWMEPCPITRPGMSLREISKSGMKRSLKWKRDEYDGDCFPMPRSWEVDDDSWMEVNSLEELEEEMKNLSSHKAKAESKSSEGRKPRRTTRRSRRNLARTGNEADAEMSNETEDDKREEDDMQSMNKMISGFRSFVEGEGELEGAVTKNETEASLPSNYRIDNDTTMANDDPETLMSRPVNIDPCKFLNQLHSMLSNQQTHAHNDSHIPANEKDDILKFFFNEDLDDGNMSVDSESDDDNNGVHQLDPEKDAFSLQSIMEAYDHALRTDADAHPSIKNLSAATEVDAENGADSSDLAILSNLLKSIDAQGGGSGPATTILKEMGICPPRLPTEEGDGG